MPSEFDELMDGAEPYAFEPSRLAAVPITGWLRKSADPASCTLVLASGPSGDLVAEIARADVVKHEAAAGDDDKRVTLHVKPAAIVAASARGRLASALVPGTITAAALGELVREPVPLPAWREIVTPFSRLDALLNVVDALSWTECRVEGKRACEALHPPGAARDACIADRYVACGRKPALRIDPRVLEQLAELFRAPPGG
jgi:hypothetical protein